MSPARIALAALLRDPPALAGAAIVALVALACLCAPLLAPCPPAEQRLWLGATPPGARHPAVGAELVLAPGRTVPAPAAARGLAVDAERRTGIDLRVRLRRGAVEIQRVVGAERVDRLDLDAAPARVVLADGSLGGERRGVLVAGAPPPAGFFAPGEPLLILRQAGPATAVRYAAELSGGAVAALRIDGAPAAEPAAIEGAAVRRIAWIDAAGGEHPLEIAHPLGTDPLGRDVLARVLHGGRISLMVGLVATLVSVVIGVLVGAVAGYAGGRIDRLLMGGVDVLYAIPFMFLVILLLVTVRGDGAPDEWRDLLLLFAALGAVQWLTMARIVRGTVLSLAARDFVLAARAAGLGAGRIVLRHVLPNCVGVVIVYATLTVPVVIMEESFLAFIGLGVSAGGVDSWGAQIDLGNQHIDWATGDRWWLLAAPTAAMLAVLAGLSLLGDRLRWALDPRRY